MARGTNPILLAEHSVTLLRGRRDGLEVALSERDFEAACDELEARLAEQPSFYEGSSAIANFGAVCPSPEELARLRGVLDAPESSLRALCGSAEGLERLAREARARLRAAGRAGNANARALGGTASAEVRLSDAARSLVADFAGARTDIAQRRKRGEASVPRLDAPSPKPAPAPALHLVEAAPGTLYHAATLRGGQVLHHPGNIVVVGDVNPGAELVATGDIVVFGRLARNRACRRRRRRGRAHLRARSRRDAAAHRDVHRRRAGRTKPRAPRCRKRRSRATAASSSLRSIGSANSATREPHPHDRPQDRHHVG